jgi:hypothetical protein
MNSGKFNGNDIEIRRDVVGGIQTDLVTFKLTYPAELDLSYFQPHVTDTCMSHVVLTR